ncbi:ATP-binding protein [Halobacteriales archaeon Cl-PHB]
MRLRTTLFALLVLIAIVLSGTVYAGFALHKGDIVDQEQRDLQATAEAIAENLDTHVEEKLRLVTLTAADPVADSHGSDSQSALLRRFVQETEFDGASIVAANGTMVAIHSRNLSADRRGELVGADFSQRLYVQRALEGNSYVGQPFRADTGNMVVLLSTPIRNESGGVVGSFNGALHLDRGTVFGRLTEMVGPDQALRIYSQNRTLYASADNLSTFMQANVTADSPGWSLTVSQDRSSVNDRLLAATVVQVGAVGLALLSIALVGIWVSRTTITHLNELIGGLTRLEDGEYDQEIDLGVTDEWAQISTQFNALAETLSQRESQLSVLNRVLRHNLRNDMSVIIAHTEQILHRDEPTEEDLRKIRQTATNLIETSEHARAIYEELLSAGDVARAPVDVVDIVQDEINCLREDFPEATIETRMPAEAWALDTDSIPIIVDELCRNALLHNDLPEAERDVFVTVESAPHGEDLRLTVRDNGPGLPPMETELLTGEREETSIEHGSGLGLWVVNWLVDQLEGRVTLTSGADRGTTVTVFLPAADRSGEV